MDSQQSSAVVGDEDRIIGPTGEAAENLKTAIDRRWAALRAADDASE